MKKRIFILILALAFMLSISAYAVEPRAPIVRPSLTFSGTTAYCRVDVADDGKYIEGTMTLYRGQSIMHAWPFFGTGVVSVTKDYQVTDGLSYVLVVTGTSGGVAFSQTVSGTC